MATQLVEFDVDLERETVDVSSVAQAAEAISSELTSYESIALGDLSTEQILFIATKGDFRTIHRRNQEVGMMVMKFHRYFEQFKPLVVAMKAKMCGARGSHLKTMVDGTYMSWSVYCKTYYGVSYRWVQKLIDADYQPIPGEAEAAEVKSAKEEDAGDEETKQTESKRLSAKDRVILDLEKKNEKLEAHLKTMRVELEKAREKFLGELANQRQALEALQETSQQATPQEATQEQIEPPAEDMETTLNRAVAHFRPIKDPTSFASDLDVIIRQCSMQKHIKTVLTEDTV